MPCKLSPKTNTRGNVIGPIDKTDLKDTDATWTIAWADKKEMYGAENLPLPGGQCPVEHKKTKAIKGSDPKLYAFCCVECVLFSALCVVCDLDVRVFGFSFEHLGLRRSARFGAALWDPAFVSRNMRRILRSDLVPAFYHEGPPALATELAHLVQASAIIDLTPGSGHWAMYAVRRQIPYLGCCYTQKHADMLYTKLRSKILSAAMDANDSDLYDARLSTLVTEKRKDTAAAVEDEGKGPAPSKPSDT